MQRKTAELRRTNSPSLRIGQSANVAWFVLLLTLGLAGPLPASGQDLPRPEDVATIDGIMKAYYEVVSAGPGEPRQWARDSSLHYPNPQIIIIRNDAAGRPHAQVMSLADFHTGTNAESGFYEYEIHRETARHGAVAHVWSTYEWRTAMDGPVGGRGVNSIQLFHDGERWWITSWMFDGRDNAPPVDAQYLPKQIEDVEQQEDGD